MTLALSSVTIIFLILGVFFANNLTNFTAAHLVDEVEDEFRSAVEADYRLATSLAASFKAIHNDVRRNPYIADPK